MGSGSFGALGFWMGLGICWVCCWFLLREESGGSMRRRRLRRRRSAAASSGEEKERKRTEMVWYGGAWRCWRGVLVVRVLRWARKVVGLEKDIF